MVSPTRYLLDTNIVVAYIRGNSLGQWIEMTYRLLGGETAPIISIVTEGELLSLALQFDWGATKQLALLNLLQSFVIVPLDVQGLTQVYADLDHASRNVGRKMGKNDLWIAATARISEATLLTTDQDFDHLHEHGIRRDYIDPKTNLTNNI